jgi:hypothetical protein
MKTSSEVFKEVLIELGFAGYKPSQMTNSDYWLCTTTAMERYAELVKNCIIPGVVKSLPTKKYEIDFGGNVLAGIEITNNQPIIIGAINGYGNGISKDEITITEK